MGTWIWEHPGFVVCCIFVLVMYTILGGKLLGERRARCIRRMRFLRGSGGRHERDGGPAGRSVRGMRLRKAPHPPVNGVAKLPPMKATYASAMALTQQLEGYADNSALTQQL